MLLIKCLVVLFIPFEKFHLSSLESKISFCVESKIKRLIYKMNYSRAIEYQSEDSVEIGEDALSLCKSIENIVCEK